MTTSLNPDKRYTAHYIEWNNDYEEYEYANDIILNGEPLQFDTYAQFLEFMAGLTSEEKIGMGLWRLDDDQLGESLTINDGEFDEVSFLSMNADKK